jgi:hypothetical protein
MAITFSNIIVGEGALFIGATEATAQDVGATQEGVEIAWEPEMVDIEVDQFGDAARVVNSKIKVNVKTKLAEGTLENMILAWNYADSELTTGGSAGTGGKQLAIGIQPVYPVERFVGIIGTAPGTTGSLELVRRYRCNRAVQYSASSHMLQRAENTAFPVDFRILPDPTQTGAEYGTIRDYASSAAANADKFNSNEPSV